MYAKKTDFDIKKCGHKDRICLSKNLTSCQSGKRARKTRKKGLQIHERTQTYVIGFASSSDDVNRKPFLFFFIRKGFLRLGALLTV